jgi:hypothetical protein
MNQIVISSVSLPDSNAAVVEISGALEPYMDAVTVDMALSITQSFVRAIPEIGPAIGATFNALATFLHGTSPMTETTMAILRGIQQLSRQIQILQAEIHLQFLQIHVSIANVPLDELSAHVDALEHDFSRYSTTAPMNKTNATNVLAWQSIFH